MLELPPSFFEHLQDRLELAVYDTNQEIRMKLFDTRKISRQELVKELEQGDREAGTIERHTSWQGEILRVDWGSPQQTTQADAMSITGLQSGAFQAKLAELKQRMAAKQAAGLAAVDAKVTDGEAKIDAAVNGVNAKIDKEVEDSLQEFAAFTNGGPA